MFEKVKFTNSKEADALIEALRKEGRFATIDMFYGFGTERIYVVYYRAKEDKS